MLNFCLAQLKIVSHISRAASIIWYIFKSFSSHALVFDLLLSLDFYIQRHAKNAEGQGNFMLSAKERERERSRAEVKVMKELEYNLNAPLRTTCVRRVQRCKLMGPNNQMRLSRDNPWDSNEKSSRELQMKLASRNEYQKSCELILNWNL